MRSCPVDGTPLTGRSDRLYCSERCSKKARRGSVVPITGPKIGVLSALDPPVSLLYA